MNAEDQVPVTLTARQWNAVLAMLSEQPYRASAVLIAIIQAQMTQFDAEQDRGRSPAAWRAVE